ncbi:MAG: hypothetical protein JNK02_09645 [Planctomycetes bacterium]|nr:hypothetical protein [Planctomycetota bacterium]
MSPTRVLLVPILALLGIAPAYAGGTEPGSFLLFPEFDNRPGQATYLTVTNVNGSTTSGSVRLHLNYVDAANCQVVNRFAVLTPRDTLTVVAAAHAVGVERGYMWCYAQSMTGVPIDFDHLIGACLRIDGVTGTEYSLPPLVLQGVPGAGLPTDVNGNGKRDLDGVEYERAPRTIYVPRFTGQSAEPLPRGTASSDIVLLHPLAGPGVTTSTAWLVWNDNEEVFSLDTSFSCWTRRSLLSVSGVFGAAFLAATNDDPLEVVGAPTIETGWFQVRATSATGPGGSTVTPQVFGFLAERRPYGAADLPFVEDL